MENWKNVDVDDDRVYSLKCVVVLSPHSKKKYYKEKSEGEKKWQEKIKKVKSWCHFRFGRHNFLGIKILKIVRKTMRMHSFPVLIF